VLRCFPGLIPPPEHTHRREKITFFKKIEKEIYLDLKNIGKDLDNYCFSLEPPKSPTNLRLFTN